MVRQWLSNGNIQNLELRLISYRTTDERIYNQSTISEVAALIIGDVDTSEMKDIIMQEKRGKLQRTNELHASYVAYRYPLICMYVEDGYKLNIVHRGFDIF